MCHGRRTSHPRLRKCHRWHSPRNTTRRQMSHPRTLSEIRGARLFRAEDAIAILQELIASSAGTQDVVGPLDPPSLDNVMLDADGSLVCRAGAVSIATLARLLETLLPQHGTTHISGALRYTIARALGHVDAPPFESVEAFSRALK